MSDCSGCHTPRNLLGGEETRDDYAGAVIDGWIAPPLNQANPSPAPWTTEELFTFLRTGASPLHGAAGATMTPVIRDALALPVVPDSDVRAIAVYFSDMDHADARAAGVETATREALATSDLAIGKQYDADANLYAAACIACHYNAEPVPLAARPEAKLMNDRKTFQVVLVLAAFNLSCEDPSKYQGSIAKFHDAAAVVIATAKATYTGLNKAERDHYVDAQVAQRLPVDPEELAKVQIFDPRETALRISSLDVLGKYSDLLVQLAATKTSTSVQSKTTELQQSLATLSGDVDKLAGANSAQFQARTKSVFPLLGAALQAFVNAKTAAALKKAIVEAVKPMNEFIGALETDMRLAHARESGFLSARRSDAYVRYRADLEAKADGVKLRADADYILTMESQWETFQSESPIAGLEAMKHAYDALVEFVRKPKPSRDDYNTLLDAVDSFVSTAGQVGQAVHTFTAK